MRMWRAASASGRRAATAAAAVLVLLAIVTQVRASENAIDGDRNCSGAACAALDDDEPPCPPDSALATTAAPDASSTARPAGDAPACVCAPGRCVTPVCRNGSRRELKQLGSGAPGDCCDVYECVPPREKNCSEVVCPAAGAACPADSFRLPGRRGPRDCCSVPQGCQCLPRPCPPPPACPQGEEPRRLRAGDGRPGSCCAAYDCAAPTAAPPAAAAAPPAPAVAPPGRRRSGGRGVRSHPPLAELPPPPPPDDEAEAEAETSTAQAERAAGEGGGGGGAGAACALDGRALEHGLSLRMDACTVCACSNGTVACERRCPPLPDGCSQSEIPDGECCPLCVAPARAAGGGCVTAAGRPMREGQRWEEDACTTCECRGGARRCEASMCQVACARPRRDPRQCCPVCDEWPARCPDTHCSTDCAFGYEADDDGCNSCRCKQESKECSLDCPGGFLLDRLGERLCKCAPLDCPPLVGCHKNCSHGFRANRQGCPVCRCNQCRPLRAPDCERSCPHGFRTNDRGCQICKCKASPDQISSPDNAVSFTLCKSSDGEVHEDGESWFDGCRQCYCHGGTEMCALIACPTLACAAPVFNASDSCCPHCPDDAAAGPAVPEPPASMVCLSEGGARRVEGETWRADACTRCLCHGGRVLCEARHCPPAACDAPAPPRAGSCCPECPLTRLAAGGGERACGRRAHATTWRDARACRSCVCVDGEERCFAERCPPAPCARPVLPKNRCCPVCLLDEDVIKHCTSGNLTYQEGEEWMDDQCTRCTCVNGQNVCAPKKCPVLCPNPMNLPEQCCPICPDLTEYTTSALLEEWKYQLIILVISVILMILIASILYQCYQNRQLKLDVSPKSCPNPAYNGYMHRNSFPPPRYTSTDRQSKCEPYQYKYVPTYDSQQFDLLKSPSFGASEKTALAPV